MRRILLVLFCTISLMTPTEWANSAAYSSSPTVQKVLMNHDSMQAVMYWTPAHSDVSNPIYGYAYTIDGTNFSQFSSVYQHTYITTISLPTRMPRKTYSFAVAPVLKDGLGPVSNVIKGELNPFLVPIDVSKVTATTDGFTFQILDVLKPGYSSSVQYFVTDIFGSDSATAQALDGQGRFEVKGVRKGEKVSVTLVKSVSNCQGFIGNLVCPYSNAVVISGSSLVQLSPPKFGETEALIDGFRATISNFESGILYTFDTPSGVTASIDNFGTVEVHGMNPSQTIKILVNAVHEGYSPSSSVLVGSSLDQTYIPEVSSAISNSKGFTLKVENFDSAFQHRVSVNFGKASISSSGLITVNGLGAGVSANVTLAVYQGNELIYETVLSGKSSLKKKSVKK